jgi:predicted dinucleotide-binding enzyme
VARLAIAAGYHVVISNSRGPETLTDLVKELGPRARASTVIDRRKGRRRRRRHRPAEELSQRAGRAAGRQDRHRHEQLLPATDGQIAELDDESTTTSELLQAHLPASKVVKAFNHIYAAQLTTDGRPAGTPNRRALVIAGDDPAAKATVTQLLDEFGFDTVDAGRSRKGGAFSATRRATVRVARRRSCAANLAAARRYADQ